LTRLIFCRKARSFSRKPWETVGGTPTRPKEPRPGQTLGAGAGTPLWNTLAAALKVECKKSGDQTKLARFVSLPRQRIHVFLNGKGPLPDAGRTLMLLQWLAVRRQTARALSQPHPGKPDAAAQKSKRV
jgi:hypothetical protein